MEILLIRTIFLYFLFALVVAIYYTNSRSLYHTIKIEYQAVLVPLMSFTAVLFALLITFTISNLWNRYSQLRLYVIEKVNKLHILYNIVKKLPNTKNITDNIEKYIFYIYKNSNEFNSFYINSLYNSIIQETIDYVELYHPYNSNFILSNIYTGENTSQISSSTSNIFFIIALIVSILTLSAFWFLTIEDIKTQFILDFIVIFVILICLFLIYQLSNPFSSKFFGLLNSGIFVDFYQQIVHPRQV